MAGTTENIGISPERLSEKWITYFFYLGQHLAHKPVRNFLDGKIAIGSNVDDMSSFAHHGPVNHFNNIIQLNTIVTAGTKCRNTKCHLMKMSLWVKKSSKNYSLA